MIAKALKMKDIFLQARQRSWLEGLGCNVLLCKSVEVDGEVRERNLPDLPNVSRCAFHHVE